MQTKLEELVNVSYIAEWRRLKAEGFPNDDRNREAAKLLERLAREVKALNGSRLHKRIERIVQADEKFGRFGEVVSEELRSVGFHSWPSSGRELLEGIASRLSGLSPKYDWIPTPPRAGR